MRTLNETYTDVGVIVGRFQVHALHEGHKALIDTVKERHDSVMIFVGLSPLRGTTSDPLDFAARKQMILEDYPDVHVYYIEDVMDDELWSRNLDRQVERWKNPHQTVTFYGSRDGFVSHYTGKFPTQVLESDIYISGTEVRRRIANAHAPDRSFRAGVIAASFNRYPTCFPTVDIAVLNFNEESTRLLLVKKPNEDKLRFPGGFASPDSETYESDARREVSEETGVSIEGLQYIGSRLINDWRYRGNTDQIKTIFYAATYVHGRPQGADDVELAQWVELDDVRAGNVEIMDEHIPLAEMLINFLDTR